MSSYIYFYIRKNDDFIPIGEYSRSHNIYQNFNEYAPYEAIQVITESTLISIRNSLMNDMNKMTQLIKENEDNKQLIASFNNSVEEKMTEINEINNNIEAAQEEYESLQYTIYYCDFLNDIIDTRKYTDNEENQCIYVGIECYKPSIENIVS